MCCGFNTPTHDFALTNSCYPRSPLPPCRARLAPWDSAFLQQVYTVVFATVPLHIANLVASLLCSNHVNRFGSWIDVGFFLQTDVIFFRKNRTFGKGLTPKAYRLSLADVQANAEKIMMSLSSTRMPYEPERSRSKKVQGLGMLEEEKYEEEDEFEDAVRLVGDVHVDEGEYYVRR